MADLDPPSKRTSGFASTSTAFSLPTSPVSPALGASLFPADDQPPSPRIFQRFRRPSLLGSKAVQDVRLTSPLASSFSYPLSRSQSSSIVFPKDGDPMWTDRSPSASSDNHTPPLLTSNSEVSSGNDSDSAPRSSSHPRTPVRHTSALPPDLSADPPLHTRRLSAPSKLPPRIKNLLSESRELRTDESEVKSEFQFQKLVQSFSALPTAPRTPGGRGRYPEEAIDDDAPASDDDDGDDELDDPGGEDDAAAYLSFAAPRTAPIAIVKPRTPSANGAGSGSVPGSPVGLMDVDGPSSVSASPSFSVASTSTTNLHQWRYTPPPTVSTVVRTNKRKYDERFDPYPASKRRAVSPSLSNLHTSLSPIYIPRPRPVPVTASLPGSVASSPTVSGSHSGSFRHAAAMGSPTMRASVALSSPIARPMRLSGKSFDDGQREVNGAGDGVGGLSLE